MARVTAHEGNTPDLCSSLSPASMVLSLPIEGISLILGNDLAGDRVMTDPDNLYYVC